MNTDEDFDEVIVLPDEPPKKSKQKEQGFIQNEIHTCGTEEDAFQVVELLQQDSHELPEDIDTFEVEDVPQMWQIFKPDDPLVASRDAWWIDGSKYNSSKENNQNTTKQKSRITRFKHFMDKYVINRDNKNGGDKYVINRDNKNGGDSNDPTMSEPTFDSVISLNLRADKDSDLQAAASDFIVVRRTLNNKAMTLTPELLPGTLDILQQDSNENTEKKHTTNKDNAAKLQSVWQSGKNCLSSTSKKYLACEETPDELSHCHRHTTQNKMLLGSPELKNNRTFDKNVPEEDADKGNRHKATGYAAHKIQSYQITGLGDALGYETAFKGDCHIISSGDK